MKNIVIPLNVKPTAFVDLIVNALISEKRFNAAKEFRNEAWPFNDDLVTLKKIANRYGYALIDDIEAIRKEKISEIDKSFDEAVAGGVPTHLGFRMKCTFEDASIVRQAAEFLQRQGAEGMTLKDIERKLHQVDLPTALLVADEMGGYYMTLWARRESKVALANAAKTAQEINAIAF